MLILGVLLHSSHWLLEQLAGQGSIAAITSLRVCPSVLHIIQSRTKEPLFPATISSKITSKIESVCEREYIGDRRRMMDSMDAARIIGYFKGKTILITGSTGFLGKILVEKIVRVQPDVSRIYLLVRATDAASAKQRVQQEVTGTELFSLLRDKYGEGFDLFIQEKLIPLAGDITKEDLGLEPATFDDLAKEMDVIVNVAATTNFYGSRDDQVDAGRHPVR